MEIGFQPGEGIPSGWTLAFFPDRAVDNSFCTNCGDFLLKQDIPRYAGLQDTWYQRFYAGTRTLQKPFISLLSQYDDMGMKENFTADEWKSLVALPYAISMAVIAAAPNILGLWSETKSMMQEPPNLAASSGSTLAGLIIAEAQSQLKDLVSEQQHQWKQDQAGYRTRVVATCKSVAVALGKVPPEEAQAYKKWVLAVGLKVAEASKEDGNAVSDPEKTALAEISAALGVST